MATTTFTFSKETRFGWGYNDAQNDVEHGRPNKWQGVQHCDPNAYKPGYLAGYIAATNGDYSDETKNAELEIYFQFD